MVIGQLTFLVFYVVFTIVLDLATRLIAGLRLGIITVVIARVITRGRIFTSLLKGVFGGSVVVGITAKVAFVIVHLNIILLLKD